MAPYVRRCSCVLVFLLALLARVATAQTGQHIITEDLTFLDPGGNPINGRTSIYDLHATTNDWVGGPDDGTGGSGVLYLGSSATLRLPTCPGGGASAQSLNKARSVVGHCSHQQVPVGFHQTLAGKTSLIQVPDATFTMAQGLNDHDVIVGFYLKDHHFQALFYRLTASVKLRPFIVTHPEGPVTSTVLQAINNKERVVGMATVGGSPWRGFFYKMGTFTWIDIPGALEVLPQDLNDQDMVAGTYVDAEFVIHPFLWQEGQLWTFALPGASFISLSSITNDGRLAGHQTSFDTMTQNFRTTGFIVIEPDLVPLTPTLASVMTRSARTMTQAVQTTAALDTGSVLCRPGAGLGGKLAAVAQVVCAK